MKVEEAIRDLAGMGHYWAILADTQPEEFLRQVKKRIMDTDKAVSFGCLRGLTCKLPSGSRSSRGKPVGDGRPSTIGTWPECTSRR